MILVADRDCSLSMYSSTNSIPPNRCVLCSLMGLVFSLEENRLKKMKERRLATPRYTSENRGKVAETLPHIALCQIKRANRQWCRDGNARNTIH